SDASRAGRCQSGWRHKPDASRRGKGLSVRGAPRRPKRTGRWVEGSPQVARLAAWEATAGVAYWRRLAPVGEALRWLPAPRAGLGARWAVARATIGVILESPLRLELRSASRQSQSGHHRCPAIAAWAP